MTMKSNGDLEPGITARQTIRTDKTTPQIIFFFDEVGFEFKSLSVHFRSSIFISISFFPFMNSLLPTAFNFLRQIFSDRNF